MHEGHSVEEEFQKYVKENDGKPVDQKVIEEVRQEIELNNQSLSAMKNSEKGFGELKEDAEILERIDIETIRSIIEDRKNISELTSAKKMMTRFLLGKLGTDFDDVKQVKLSDIIDNKNILRSELNSILNIIEKYHFDENISICEIPNIIDKEVDKISKALYESEDLHRHK